MFDNTLSLYLDGAVEETLSVTDTDNGTTTRSINLGGGNALNLTIAHSESTENKGVVSDRYLVRLDEILTETSSPYAPTKASVYQVYVVPRRPDVTPTKVAELAAKLHNFLLDTEPVGSVGIAAVNPVLTRITAGET